MSLAALVRRLVDAGASPEVIAIAVEAMEAPRERSANAARQARFRERRALHAVTSNVTDNVTDNAERVSPPPPAFPPMIDNNSTPHPPTSTPSQKSLREAVFARFWQAWPNRVGKPAAERAFAKVADEIEAILRGVAAYGRSKPADRPWLNPATFLNQRRWEDAPAPLLVSARGPPGNRPMSRAEILLKIANPETTFDQPEFDIELTATRVEA